MNELSDDRIPSLRLRPGPFMAAVRAWLDETDTFQATLSDRAGVSQYQFSRWVRGHIAPSLESRVKLRHGIILLEKEMNNAE